MEPFSYPPLPPGKDAIRILNIEPGDFYDDPIVCTLTSATFTSKPRYLALSYTWGDAFPHNRSLPTNKSMPAVPMSDFQLSATLDAALNSEDMFPSHVASLGISSELEKNMKKAEPVTINGQPFAIHHNLHLCLLHLRPRKGSPSLPLWVDAVCINQADADERNAQVALMSFIYPRAQAVVAWLGVPSMRDVKPNPKTNDVFKTMAMVATGPAPGLLQTLAQGGVTISGYLDSAIANEAAKSSYWTRLWVLQEACLASQLVFLYGSKFWTFDKLSDWQSTTNDLHKVHGAAMVRMIEARRARYTDAMKLEILAEQFRGLACSELRDRIYGLVGLANDIRPFFASDHFQDPVEDHIASLEMGTTSIRTMQRGMGRLRVDYSASFYDIWRDVLKNLYFRVGPLEHKCRDNTWQAWTALFKHRERRIRVVRSAGVMQEILGREVGKEFYRSPPVKMTPEKPCVRALGYVASEILQIGPSYTSLISSADATYDWVDCWENSYETGYLGELREVNETYLRRIITYTDEDVAYIRPIKSRGTIARPAGASVSFNIRPRGRAEGGPSSPKPSPPAGEHGDSESSPFGPAFQAIWQAKSSDPETGPNICLGSGRLIALVPAMAKVGDIIVRFWDCSTAAVMRPVAAMQPLDSLELPSTLSASGPASYLLVGKADISQPVGRWEEPILYQPGPGVRPPPTGIPYTSSVLDVDLDFRSLQMLSAPIGPG